MIAQILQWSGLALATASTTFAVIKTIKAGKKNKLVKLAKIVQTIPESINEAEQVLGPGTGSAKLTYVLNKLNIKCLQAGIDFDELGLTQEIENVLATPQKKERKYEA